MEAHLLADSLVSFESVLCRRNFVIVHALMTNVFRFIWWADVRAFRRVRPRGELVHLHAPISASPFAYLPSTTCRPHDGTVLFVGFRLFGLFREQFRLWEQCSLIFCLPFKPRILHLQDHNASGTRS